MQALPRPPMEAEMLVQAMHERHIVDEYGDLAKHQLPHQHANAECAQALPKLPTEAEMRELLQAMQLEGPAPGAGDGGDHAQDMRFTFSLTVRLCY